MGLGNCKKLMKVCVVLVLVAVTSGCASGLNSMQKREYAAFEMDGVLVEEKNPSVGAALGILPGFGSFYAREPALGIANLLLWPISVLWDPVSGYDGAMVINYDLTKMQLKKKKQKELSALDLRLKTGEIDTADYMLSKSELDNKYDYAH